MPERVEAWWARRQWSKGTTMPYAIGHYRDEWSRWPVLVRQYHPEFNAGVVLSQVPPAADVWLQWQCEVGHIFVATPDEVRSRAGQSRRRSSWCPDCFAGAAPPAAPQTLRPTAPPTVPSKRRPPRAVRLCSKSDAAARHIGEPFLSACAPTAASAAEPRLAQLLASRLTFAPGFNAVRVPRPFFTHLEVWPDIVVPELKVAIEYDTMGRNSNEHVGQREVLDRRKDRLMRAAGWEVVRVRTGRLRLLGEHDVAASAVTGKLVDRLLDAFRDLRGDLIVNCYLR